MTPEQYAEIMRQLADVGSATARLADRLDRMEQREQHQAAIVRDVDGEAKPTKLRFWRELRDSWTASASTESELDDYVDILECCADGSLLPLPMPEPTRRRFCPTATVNRI